MHRKLFTLPEELSERLSKEHNQSKTVSEALERYFAGKDGTKELAKLTVKTEGRLEDIEETLRKLNGVTRQIATAMNNMGASIDLR